MNNIHIALNAQLLSLEQNYRSAGVSWYIYNLLTHMDNAKAEYSYTAFLNEPKFFPPTNVRPIYGNFSTVSAIRRTAWEQLFQPTLLLKEKVSLLHSLSFVAPVVCPCKSVVTILDLAFEIYPNTYPALTRQLLSKLTKHSARRADSIIAISESTRQDVINYYKIPPNKVHTVHCGVDTTFRVLEKSVVDEFKQKKGLPKQFVFRLGTLEPRKNVEGLIQAYAKWYQNDHNAPKLFIGGGKGWYYQEIFKLVEELKLEDKIIFTGYIPQEELPLWYNAADLFVYPSFFEGFGLPILEAMACGTPVITSNVSSMPEVAGSAAILIDPHDVEALSDSMRMVSQERDLHSRLSEHGLMQAKKFSWDKTVSETVAVYAQVLRSQTLQQSNLVSTSR